MASCFGGGQVMLNTSQFVVNAGGNTHALSIQSGALQYDPDGALKFTANFNGSQDVSVVLLSSSLHAADGLCGALPDVPYPANSYLYCGLADVTKPNGAAVVMYASLTAYNQTLFTLTTVPAGVASVVLAVAYLNGTVMSNATSTVTMIFNQSTSSFAVSSTDPAAPFSAITVSPCAPPPPAGSYCGSSDDDNISVAINVSMTTKRYSTTLILYDYSAANQSLSSCKTELAIFPDGRVVLGNAYVTFAAFPPSCPNISALTFDGTNFTVTYKSRTFHLSSDRCSVMPANTTVCGSITDRGVTTRATLNVQQQQTATSLLSAAAPFALAVSMQQGSGASTMNCTLSGTAYFVKSGFFLPTFNVQSFVFSHSTPDCTTFFASTGSSFGIFLGSDNVLHFRSYSLATSGVDINLPTCTNLPAQGWYCGTNTFQDKSSPKAQVSIYVGTPFSSTISAFFGQQYRSCWDGYAPFYGIFDAFGGDSGTVVTNLTAALGCLGNPFYLYVPVPVVVSGMSYTAGSFTFGFSDGSSMNATADQCYPATFLNGSYCGSNGSHYAQIQASALLEGSVMTSSMNIILSSISSTYTYDSWQMFSVVHVLAGLMGPSPTNIPTSNLRFFSYTNQVSVTSFYVSSVNQLNLTFALSDVNANTGNVISTATISISVGLCNYPFTVPSAFYATTPISFGPANGSYLLFFRNVSQFNIYDSTTSGLYFIPTATDVHGAGTVPFYGMLPISGRSVVALLGTTACVPQSDITCTIFATSGVPAITLTLSSVSLGLSQSIPLIVPDDISAPICGTSSVKSNALFFAYRIDSRNVEMYLSGIEGPCQANGFYKGALPVRSFTPSLCAKSMTIGPAGATLVTSALETITMTRSCMSPSIPSGLYCGANANFDLLVNVQVSDTEWGVQRMLLTILRPSQVGRGTQHQVFVSLMASGALAFTIPASTFLNFTSMSFDNLTRDSLLISVLAANGSSTADVDVSLSTAGCGIKDLYFRVTDVIAGSLTATNATSSTFVEKGLGASVTFGKQLKLGVTTNGTLLVADRDNKCVRAVQTSGNVSTLAGRCGAGSGSPLSSPSDLVFDKSTNVVYVVDSDTGIVSSLSMCGIVTTVQTGFFSPVGIAIHPISGRLYVSQQHSVAIVQLPSAITKTYVGTTVSGYVNGGSTIARFNTPGRVAFTSNGLTVYVPDTGNNCIRRVSATGLVTTLSGSTIGGFLDGALTFAQFQAPTEIWLLGNTLLYVIDGGNKVVRAVNISSVTVNTASAPPGDAVGLMKFANPSSIASTEASDGVAYFAACGSQIVRFVA